MSEVSVNDANFQSEVLESNLPVLVDFWAPWCGPCKAMSPVVDAIAAEFAGKVKVVKVDIGDAPQTAVKYGVVSIPTFLVVQAGKVKTQFTGVRPKQALLDAIQAN